MLARRLALGAWVLALGAWVLALVGATAAAADADVAAVPPEPVDFCAPQPALCETMGEAYEALYEALNADPCRGLLGLVEAVLDPLPRS